MSQGLFLDLDDLHYPKWHQQAACKGQPLAVFFPEGRGEPCQQAKAICRRCPVQLDCLQWALQRKERYGVWGGTSYKDRRNSVKMRRLIEALSNPE